MVMVTMAAVKQPQPFVAPLPPPPPPAPVRPRSTNGVVSSDVEVDADMETTDEQTEPPSPVSQKHEDKQQHQHHPEPATTPAADTTGAVFSSGPQRGDPRIVVIVYAPGQEGVLAVFADVLGQPFRTGSCFGDVTSDDRGVVVGLPAAAAHADLDARDRELVVAVNAHCVNLGMPPDAFLSENCDYEFLYTDAPFFRRDLARFVSFTLGQISHHDALMAKPRTFIISTTFPDVRAALPNIDILTVGADAVELRVDLLEEPLADGSGGHAAVPSLSYVGEQVMLLRQRTELPIIFTTRCTAENGRFPMADPDLYLRYLYRAVQWGVEYIDVEVWLPEDVRRTVWERRGSSRVMSAFHDFSGAFRWPSPRAEAVFHESRRFADVVKMIAIINDHNENFELEYFRLRMGHDHPDAPPLSAVNMGETGQFSRTLNRVFTPITHPLLPLIAAPGQMSAAQINAALALVGQLPKKSIYGIIGPASRGGATPQAPFYEKCFNELGLPHHFAVVERQPRGAGGVDAWCNQRDFGGAYLNPPMPHHDLTAHSPFFRSVNHGLGPVLTEAARIIGVVDTIVVRPASPAHIHINVDRNAAAANNLPPGTELVFDNALWRGVLSTLTRDLAPSAYMGASAVVLAATPDDAASALFALKALRVAKVYTGGFRTPPALATGLKVEPFTSLESLHSARSPTAGDGANRTPSPTTTQTAAAVSQAPPFVIVSALGPEKSALVGMVVRLFGTNGVGKTEGGGGGPGRRQRRVFLDLAEPGGPRRMTDPATTADQHGFAAYGLADTAAFATVERLRVLVGQNVPYSFVRLASGRVLY